MIDFAALFVAPPELARHAAALVVLGPLVASCAAALSPSTRWAWAISIAASAFSFWMALALAGEVAREGTVVYAMGGFEPPYGITFRIDAMGAMFALLISSVATLSAIYSGYSLKAEIREGKQTLFQAGFLLCLAGLLGMTSTGDAFNAFVFLEISSIGTYALIGTGASRDRRALPAAFNYLILGTIGATFYVIGVGFLYAAAGTLNMADLAQRLPELQQSRAAEAGFAFIMVGLGLKAAMFPLHGWLPGAYAHAPSLMNVFLSATATKAAIYLMVRFSVDVFHPESVIVERFFVWVLAPMAGLAAIVCSIQAIFQTELRRILAFSSVAQVGYMMLAIAVGSAAGISAGLLHLTAHALMKAALFMAIGGVTLSVSGLRLSDFNGAGRTAPWTMTPFAIASFSLLGVPLTLGFLSKWRLIEATLEGDRLWAVAVIAIASVLSLIYVGRMLEALFFQPAQKGEDKIREAPIGALIPLWILAAATIWFGIDGRIVEQLATAAASAAVGGF